ncbi:MAG TPA: DNA recombination protein RmuC, partial [Steroidobacteraceae bacterium]|nr:DNA recombination protein RmuC [Steroidobacteraceae bacterium]
MSTSVLVATLVGLIIGGLVGVLAATWRGRRKRESLHLELAVVRAQVKTDERIDSEREEALNQAIERLRSTFDHVAGQSMRSNSEVFLKLAREHLGQHNQNAATALMQREKAIEALVAPIRDALNKTEQQIQSIEKERAESFGSLRSSIEAVTAGQAALQKETRTLVNALRRPEVRGQWGELTLRRLAELAGMVEHCDFAEQVHVRTEDG